MFFGDRSLQKGTLEVIEGNRLSLERKIRAQSTSLPDLESGNHGLNKNDPTG